jgi:hypothetical protein
MSSSNVKTLPRLTGSTPLRGWLKPSFVFRRPGKWLGVHHIQVPCSELLPSDSLRCGWPLWYLAQIILSSVKSAAVKDTVIPFFMFSIKVPNKSLADWRWWCAPASVRLMWNFVLLYIRTKLLEQRSTNFIWKSLRFIFKTDLISIL